jgi:hypothetical protein
MEGPRRATFAGRAEGEGEMSELDPIAMYPAVPGAVGAATITIGKIREVGARGEHDPEWRNWYHGSIFGITGGMKKKLHKAAVEIVEIDQAEAARLHSLWDSARTTLPT